MADFIVGELSRTYAVFNDPITGLLVDPSAVASSIRFPDGTIVNYVYSTDIELQRESQGVYYLELSLDTEGEYSVYIQGTGTGQGAGNTKFTVATKFPAVLPNPSQ